MTDAERIKGAIAWIDGYLGSGPVNAGDNDSFRCDTLGALRSILSPPPKTHYLYGVPFEETGECRVPREGEWVLFSDGQPTPTPTGGHWACDYPILRYAPEGSSQ